MRQYDGRIAASPTNLSLHRPSPRPSPRLSPRPSSMLTLPKRRRAPTLLIPAGRTLAGSRWPSVMVTCASWASTNSMVSEREFGERETDDGLSQSSRGSTAGSGDDEVQELEDDSPSPPASAWLRLSEVSDAETLHWADTGWRFDSPRELPPREELLPRQELHPRELSPREERQPYAGRRSSRELPFANFTAKGLPRLDIADLSPVQWEHRRPPLARRKSIELSPRSPKVKVAKPLSPATSERDVPAACRRNSGARSSRYVATTQVNEPPPIVSTSLSDFCGRDELPFFDHESRPISPQRTDRLEKLTIEHANKLRDLGLLEHEEFEKVKSAILRRLDS
ncbi:hypothetical protein T492DRAFT_1086502 [Pavlovales sp. CCMP2436]|nr:hypothetical protein T492DRAFT_1086502 [Pavlovales sp. CCMP2436]